MKKVIGLLCVALLLVLSSCSKRELLIVTTTSLDNSGLLEYILPVFEEEYNVKVKVVALGTGAALELGERGEADILLVHDTAKELEFINENYGTKRDDVMYNDFIFIGPNQLNGTSISEVLLEISSNHFFYSRGDNSGTHSKELSLWVDNNYDVATFGDWYLETGQGMGSTITMANLSGYYTLTDRGTYLSMKENIDLVISYENTEELLNQYGVIMVNPLSHNRDTEFAELFYDWILTEETQALIGTYIKYDEVLFHPQG